MCSSDLGIAVAPSCETIGLSGSYRFRLDPVPDDPVSGTALRFDRPPRAGTNGSYEVAVTRATAPYEELGRARPEHESVTVELPADVARRARRDGMALRAEVWDGSELRMIWRFRVKPAR